MFVPNFVITVIAIFHHSSYTPYTGKEVSVAVLASFIFIIAILSINGSISYGKAGPVCALAQL